MLVDITYFVLKPKAKCFVLMQVQLEGSTATCVT